MYSYMTSKGTMLKVGNLAEKTDLTVRTLHYYEEIGLLRPAQRTPAGHRLYSHKEVLRLQQILSLRALGLSLEEIRASLEQADFSLLDVLTRHMHHLQDQIAEKQDLYRRLETIRDRLQEAAHVSIDDLTTTIKMIAMHEKYYTPDQLETLKQRGENLGEERMQQVQEEWKALFASFRAEMEQGTDPAHARVQALAERGQQLINEFTGGDPAIGQSLKTMYEQEGPAAASHNMVDPAVYAYMKRAMESAE